MSESCEHRWLVRRETRRKAGWRLRVYCCWCLQQKLWPLSRGPLAANWLQWRRTHPDPRRSPDDVA